MKMLYVALSIIVFIIIALCVTALFDRNIKDKLNTTAYRVIDRKSNINVERVTEEGYIPKQILQTYKTLEEVPDYVISNIKTKNPDWEYIFYDDSKCIEFLGNEFGEPFVTKFKSFKKGAHKSDLFRICWLYKNGGVYMDIDSELIVPLTDIIDTISGYTILQNDVRGSYYYEVITKILNTKHDRLVNSFMIINKGNDNIKKCINNIMKVEQKDLEGNYALILFIMQITIGEEMSYQIFERRPDGFNPISKRMEMYTIDNKKIGYTCYNKYKNGSFKN